MKFDVRRFFEEVLKCAMIVIICIGLVFLIMIGIWYAGNTGEPTTDEQAARSMISKTAEPMTEGILTILTDGGEVFYQYQGEIDIVSDGSNGEIYIQITLPEGAEYAD